MVPLNLFGKSKKCDMIHTGTWTKKARGAAEKFGSVNVIASSEDKNFSYIPKIDPSKFDAEADYFYICSNNTIEGTRYTSLPNTGKVPLVADMSSEILSAPIDINKFGLIFAGAQKNIGPAGLTIVIVRDELVGHAQAITPTMLDYQIHAKERSMYNTPPTYGIYMAMLVFEWLKEQGGLAAIEEKNKTKAALLYDFLDNSSLFKGTAAREDRSLMNIPFLTGSNELDTEFIKSAEKEGLTNLAGHRSVGGMRASVYNAMPIEGVKKLVDFMKKFELEHK
jgi:phosphoserine aminotransferase